MIDREKVIRGLSVCGHDAGVPNQCELFDCPYRGDAWCQHELAGDALALIHGQDEEVANLTTKIAELTTERARVMTLEEVHAADICWVEVPGDDRVLPGEAIARNLLMSGNTTEIQFVGDGEISFRQDADYGRTWRCWTSKPTDEQRDAVKWE